MPSEFYFHVFAPSFNAILLPVNPAFWFPSSLSLFLQSEVKVLTPDVAPSWKASSIELDHPLSSIYNSVFSHLLTLYALFSEPESLSYFLSLSLFDHFHLSMPMSPFKLFLLLFSTSWFQHLYLFNLISTPAQLLHSEHYVRYSMSVIDKRPLTAKNTILLTWWKYLLYHQWLPDFM